MQWATQAISNLPISEGREELRKSKNRVWTLIKITATESHFALIFINQVLSTRSLLEEILVISLDRIRTLLGNHVNRILDTAVWNHWCDRSIN